MLPADRRANLVQLRFNTTPQLFVRAEVVEGLLSRPTVDSQLIDDSLLIRLNELVQDTEGLPNCKFNKC
mgnify:CR=1 FL=1